MSDGHALDYQSLIAAAESAAAAGDLSRTEALFREAIEAQEHELGPAHPGLASTCNNLAVVCERAGHLHEAEYYYRRAYAIAVSLLQAKDPLVQTSFDNLKAFCESQGLPLADWPDLGGHDADLPTQARPASLSTVPRRPSPASQSITAGLGDARGAEVTDLFGVYAASGPALPTGSARSVVTPAAPSPEAEAIAEPSAASPSPAPVAEASPPPATSPAATTASRRRPPMVRAPAPAPLPPSPAPPLTAPAGAASSTTATTARAALSRPVATAAAVAAVLAGVAGLWPASRDAGSASDVAGTPAPNATVSAATPSGAASAAAADATPAPSAPTATTPEAAPRRKTLPTPTPPQASPRPTAEGTATKTVVPATSSSTPRPPATAPPVTPSNRSDRRPTPAAGLRLVTASVCATLDTRARPWRCAPVGDEGASGPVTYYTRIASTDARTRVEHRWYQGDSLRLTRALTIGYSPTEGYRTYSRYTPAPGQWRVELVSADGIVMHEARFAVR